MKSTNLPCLRFGDPDSRPRPIRTCREVAEIFAARGTPLSRVRIRAIEQRAFEKLLAGVEKLLRKEGLS